MDINVQSVSQTVYETAKTRVYERREYTTDPMGNQTIRSEFWYVPLYNKHGQEVNHTEPGQTVDRRA